MEGTTDKLEYLDLEKPTNSLSLKTKLSQKKKPASETDANQKVRLAKEYKENIDKVRIPKKADNPEYYDWFHRKKTLKQKFDNAKKSQRLAFMEVFGTYETLLGETKKFI